MKQGKRATVTNNVLGNVGGMGMKGDEHTIKNNLALQMWSTNGLNDDEANEDDDGFSFRGILVPWVRKMVYDYPMNENSIVENNAAMYMSGDSHSKSCKNETLYRQCKNAEPKCEAHWPLGGPDGKIHKSNNYYGDYSMDCGETYDGSVILNGETLSDFTDMDFPDLFIDLKNRDFRPKPSTDTFDNPLLRTGIQIGPYPDQSKYSNGGKYAIPGRKMLKASHPIPEHEAIVSRRDDLIFRPAYE